MQVPAWQASPAEQPTPQAPQLPGSVARSVQTPPQTVCPAAQAHAPARQLWPPVQVTPQAPQLALSVAVSTQAPEQAVAVARAAADAADAGLARPARRPAGAAVGRIAGEIHAARATLGLPGDRAPGRGAEAGRADEGETQTAPQAPQFAPSPWRFTQAAPHRSSPS
jgi:hypothetical protein